MTLSQPLVPFGYQPAMAQLPLFTPGQPAGLNQLALGPGQLLSAGNPNMAAANGGIPFQGRSMAGQAAARAAAAQQAGIGAVLSQGARSATPGAGTAAARPGGAGLFAGAARAGSGVLPSAAASAPASLGARLLGPGGVRGMLGRGNLARGLGWGLAGAVGGAAGQGIAGALGAGEETSADVGRMINYGLLGAGFGAMTGPGALITAPIGAAIGTGIGALGFIPGIEDAPIIGGLWGGKKGPTATDTLTSIRGNMADVLTSMGADQSFINRANRQLTIALQVNNPDPEKENFGAYKTEDLRTIGAQIMDGMIQQFGMEQQNTQQGADITGSFDSALAEIMAAQAYMQPLLQNQMAVSQQYADQYAASARAAAGTMTDPALAAAGAALANQFSADQASSNQLALQQLMYQPAAWQQQLEQQYNEQMLALQQQSLQLQQQQMAAGGQSGLAPGLYPMS